MPSCATTSKRGANSWNGWGWCPGPCKSSDPIALSAVEFPGNGARDDVARGGRFPQKMLGEESILIIDPMSRSLEAARLSRLLRLVGSIPTDLPTGPVLDLGCGEGRAAALLRTRFAGRRLEGLDRDAAALAVAAPFYDVVHQQDHITWEPQEPYSLIFAAAVFHQTGSLAAVLPWFVRCLEPGGVLAFSLPRNETLAVTALMHSIAAQLFPGRIPDLAQPEGHMEELFRILAPLGETRVWSHEELRPLRPAQEGHPIRLVTEESLVRPLLAGLDPEEIEACLEAIDKRLHASYPVDPAHGTALRLREICAVCRVPA